ncbi:hypothetical protein KKF32_02660 [Patescibacteria group bacterium]|nr:hypothetical protein [Patescibacteria group bacterium]
MIIFKRKEEIKYLKRILNSLLIFLLVSPLLFFNFDKPSNISDLLEPPKAQAQNEWLPTSASVEVGSEYPVQDSIANIPSYRALFSSDDYHWTTRFDASNGLDKRVNIDGVRLQSANKMIITYEGYVSQSVGVYTVDIYDYISTTWRTLNWREASFSDTTETSYTFEIYNGYWQSGGTAINTPLSNFISTDGDRQVRIRVYSSYSSKAVVHYWDTLQIELAIDPVYYASSLTRLNGWTGTITNDYTYTNYSDDTSLIATNQTGTPLDFYLSFDEIETYTGANTIFVGHRGNASNAALTHNVEIYNFDSTSWETLNGTALSNTSLTDYYFAKNNVTLTDYISSNEVRIRYVTAMENTYTLSLDLVYILIGSTNADTDLCEVTYGTVAGATTCANTRSIDTSSADSTWQQTTASSTSTPGYYPGDYGLTWGSYHAASANLWVPITIPSNRAVTGMKYAARFRSNYAAIKMMPSIKDMSGLNSTEVDDGDYTLEQGGWVDVYYLNNSTTYTMVDPVSITLHSSPEDFIDTHNNRANFRMRTSYSTWNSAVTRDWDFTIMSIRTLEDDTTAADNPRYVATGGTLATGTAYGVYSWNTGSSTALYDEDQDYWFNYTSASGYDLHVDVDGVNLNNANKIIITYRGRVTTSSFDVDLLIYDNASFTWRKIADTDDTPLRTYYYHIFDGFWNDGNDPISTPLSNFINEDKRMRFRFFTTHSTSYRYHYFDAFRIELATDPVYYAKDFIQEAGSGSVTNNYTYTHPAAISTADSDDLRLGVENDPVDVSFEYSLVFGNVQTYTGANAILVNYEGYTSASLLTYALRIYNFDAGRWEDLSAAKLDNTSDATYQFSTGKITLSDYISSNEIKIGIYTTTSTAGTHYTDYMYVTIGSVVDSTDDAEITIGSTSSGTAANTQTLDTSSAVSGWTLETSASTTNPYALDWVGLININQGAAANVNLPATLASSTAVTGIRYAQRMLSGSSDFRWKPYLRDYSGLADSTGGFLGVDSYSNSASTYYFDDGWLEDYFRNAEDCLNVYNSQINVNLREYSDSSSSQGPVINPVWDFNFVSIKWYENSANSYYDYKFTPTSGSLTYGVNFAPQDAVQNAGSYKAIFTADDQRWVVKNDLDSTGLDVRVNMDNVEVSSQSNKISVTFEGYVSSSDGTFFLQIYDSASSTWRTLNEIEAAVAPTTETSYTFEIFDGRWQEDNSPTSTPLSNFITTDSNKRIQLRFYSTVTTDSFALYIDELSIKEETDTQYFASDFTLIAGTNTTNNYSYTFASDDNRMAVTDEDGTAFNYYLSFNNVQPYTGANAIFVYYEGKTTIAYKPKIYNFTGSSWEDLQEIFVSHSGDMGYPSCKSPISDMDDYVSDGEVRVGFYTTGTSGAQTHYLDYMYIVIGSVVDSSDDTEVSFGSETGGTYATATQSIDFSNFFGYSYWGATSATTADTPYYGDFTEFDGTYYSVAANISFPATVPTNGKVTAIRYIARFLSGSNSAAVEYVFRDYSGAGATGGYLDPGNYYNQNGFMPSYYNVEITPTNPEHYVNMSDNEMNMRIRTTSSAASSGYTMKWDFAFVSFSWRIDSDHPSFSDQLTAVGGSIQVGTAVATSSSNMASWRATLGQPYGYWGIDSTASGFDVRLNIDGVNLNNANKIIISHISSLSGLMFNYSLQIYDNASSTWRSLVDGLTAEVVMQGFDNRIYFPVFDGRWNDGDSATSTSLSNFVTDDANKRVQLRYYSTDSAAASLSIYYLALEVATDPVYWAKGFSKTTGSGSVTNNYTYTYPSSDDAMSTGGEDESYLQVENVDSESFDFYLPFGNVQTYPGVNAIMLYYHGYTSTASLTYKPKIYNFSDSAWENLTTTAMDNTSNTAYQFAKAPVTLSNYIYNGELRIGFYTPTTQAGTLYLDLLYVTIGTVISSASDIEVSFGSSDGSSVLNTQSLDTTLGSPSVYGVNTTLTDSSFYPYDYVPGLYDVAMGGAANIDFDTTLLANTYLTGVRYAGRYKSSSDDATTTLDLLYYGGASSTLGGWIPVGTDAASSYVFTEGWHTDNINSHISDLQNLTNLRFRTSESSLDNQVTMAWDFAFVSLRWAPTTASGGTLSTDIVDADGDSVSSPSVTMTTAPLNFDCHSNTGTFGSSTEKIRVNNTTINNNWTLTIAASSTTAYWDGTSDYDFNDSNASGCTDGADADGLAGQLTFDPSVATITAQSGCSTSGLSLGSQASFVESSVDSVTLITSTYGEANCYWDLTGVDISQTIPAEQAIDSYSIDMIVTITAS